MQDLAYFKYTYMILSIMLHEKGGSCVPCHEEVVRICAPQ